MRVSSTPVSKTIPLLLLPSSPQAAIFFGPAQHPPTREEGGGCPASPNSSQPVFGKVGAGHPPPPGSLREPLPPRRLQAGPVVSDVSLPPWARGCPRTFVHVHRAALESAEGPASVDLSVDPPAHRPTLKSVQFTST